MAQWPGPPLASKQGGVAANSVALCTLRRPLLVRQGLLRRQRGWVRQRGGQTTPLLASGNRPLVRRTRKSPPEQDLEEKVDGVAVLHGAVNSRMKGISSPTTCTWRSLQTMPCQERHLMAPHGGLEGSAGTRPALDPAEGACARVRSATRSSGSGACAPPVPAFAMASLTRPKALAHGSSRHRLPALARLWRRSLRLAPLGGCRLGSYVAVQ